jgi:hypothetical protein
MNEFDRLIQKAQKTNRRRDHCERGAGFATPDSDRESLLRTVVSALEAGVRRKDWDCVAEGLVMLADATDYHPWLVSR